MAGAVIETDPQARAEIRIGPQAVELAGGTVLDIARLDDRVVDLAVRQGRVGVRLRQLQTGDDVEIDVARGGVWPLAPGSYDINAGDAQRPTRIAAFDGSARFVGGGADVAVLPGQQTSLSGDKDHLASIVSPAAEDAFVRWCRARDGGGERHLAALYFVAPVMTGYDALDRNGSWEGGVWYPRALPANWAPYRFGRWRWIAPWGWTWIDDQPWGFAPSHYGRWTDIDGRWGWVPGSYAAQPLYAPAFVAFLGTPGVGLSFADGSGPGIGWFPIAPGEVYWPGYSADLGYIRRLNQPNVADLGAIRLRPDGEPPREVFDAHFADREFASVVPRSVFAGGGAVAPALVHLPEQRLLDAPVIMGSPQIQSAAAAPAKPAVAPPAPKSSPAKTVVVLRGGRGKPSARAALRLVRTASHEASETHLRVPARVLASTARHGRTLALQAAARGPVVIRGRLAHSLPVRLARFGHVRQLRR